MASARPASKVFDAYPSRIFETPRLIDRLDPVVYGPRQGTSLSREQIFSFENNGFLLIPNFLTASQVAKLRSRIEDLAQDPELAGRPEVIREPNGRIRSIFAPHLFHKMFKSLATSRGVLAPVEDILGSAVYLHQYRINMKPAFEGREFYWHSDFETWHVEDGMPRMRALSCMIFLETNNEFNGPLMVIPGSHRTYVSCVGETPREHYKFSLVKQEYGVPDEASLSDMIKQMGLTSLHGPAGSLLLFDCNIMHSSTGNISPFGRSNLFLVYNSIENSLLEPYCGLSPRPDYVANRKPTPL